MKNDLILKLSDEGTRSTEYLACPCTMYRTLVSKVSHICVWTVSIHEGVKVNQSTTLPTKELSNVRLAVPLYETHRWECDAET